MSTHPAPTVPSHPSRRQVVVGCAVVCAAGTAACSGDAEPAPTVSRSGSGEAVARVADLKAGVALAATGPAGQPIVLVRPAADAEPVAFSAICPHAGCTVAPSADGTELVCPCHGSTFDPLTGKRLSGPAQAPLSGFQVAIEGDSVIAL